MPRIDLIQLRRGTAALWTSENPVLDPGEPGIETDTLKHKWGDGVTAWNSLPYPTVSGAAAWGGITGTLSAQTDLVATLANKISLSGTELHATATGTNTYSATLSPVPAYASGLTVRIKFTNANTTAATINLNGLGAKAIKKNVSVDLASGDIPAGAIVELIYDGTNFQAIGILTASSATWGAIGGTLSAQTDLVTALAGKVSITGAELHATATGTNTYAATLTPTPVYASGLTVRIKFTNANTGASTINLNSLGAKSIKKSVSVDLSSGDIPAGSVVELVYDGTNFQAVGIVTAVGATWGSITGTLGTQSDLAAALAAKVDETDFVVLTDGAITTWDTTNLQTPLAKWTMGATSRTLAMTNLKGGASGLLVVKTGIAGVITLTFPAGSVTDAGSLTTYAFPAGINVFYDLTWYYDSTTTTIKWLIGVSNIDNDITLVSDSSTLVPSVHAAKSYSDTNLLVALDYADALVEFLPWKNIVDVATTAALPANTIDGPYQIITASANGALTVDGQTGFTKILVKDEADQKKNGKYDVIAAGSAGTPYQLRRSTDFDASNKIRAAVVHVLNGTVNAGKFFKQDTSSVTIGTSNIVFSEFGSNTSIGVQDLYIPATAMWPRSSNGCAVVAVSELATSLLNIQTLDFDQTTQEFAQFTISLPRNWNNGTVTMKLYWTAAAGTAAQGVVWGVKAGAYSDGDALTVALGSEQTSTDALSAANNLHITPYTSAITIAGTPADADMLAFQISRNPADASDTLAADAKLIGVSIALTIDASTAA